MIANLLEYQKLFIVVSPLKFKSIFNLYIYWRESLL